MRNAKIGSRSRVITAIFSPLYIFFDEKEIEWYTRCNKRNTPQTDTHKPKKLKIFFPHYSRTFGHAIRLHTRYTTSCSHTHRVPVRIKLIWSDVHADTLILHMRCGSARRTVYAG